MTTLQRALAVPVVFVCATVCAAEDPEPRVPLFAPELEGATIALVYVDLRDPTGAELDDPSARDRLAAAFGLQAGSPFSITAADVGVQQVRRQPAVGSARWELYQSSTPGQVVVVLFVVYDPEAEPPPRTGWLITGNAGDFPTLVETDRSLLRAQLNLSAGWFGEHDPWWGAAEAFVGGSPPESDPAGPGWTSWGEGAVEAGVHGASQLGARPV